jgi:hypothetical protein
MRNRKLFTAIFFALSLFVLQPPETSAQVSLVLDSMNLMQAIDTLYATYDHITQTIETVKNTYEQLQRQIDMVKNMKWDNVQESFANMDPTSLEGILDMRNQIDDVFYYVNKNMNIVNAVEDTLTKKRVNFGGKNYTFGGLFGIGQAASDGTTIFDLPKNMLDYVDETASDVTAGYEGRLSYAQKEAIANRHGLSPRNYAKVRLVEEQTAALINTLIVTGSEENAIALLERAAEDNKGVDILTQAAGESMVAQQQATTQALLNIAGNLARLEIGVTKFSGLVATGMVGEFQVTELRKQEDEIRTLQNENERRKHLTWQDWY